MKTTLFLLAVSISIATVSCSYINSEDDINIQVQVENQPHESSLGGGECTPDNANNPLDSVGEKHNEYVLLAQSICDDSATPARVLAVTDSLLTLEFGSTLVTNIGFDIEDTEEIIDGIDTDYLATYLAGLPFSDLDEETIPELLNIMYDYDATNICEIIEEIKSYEDSLLTIYSASQLRVFLCASSTARYSLYHWDEAVSETELTQVQPRGFWKIFFIAVCDAAGAAAGGLAGQATVVGAVAGAIVGGVTASNTAGALWDRF